MPHAWDMRIALLASLLLAGGARAAAPADPFAEYGASGAAPEDVARASRATFEAERTRRTAMPQVARVVLSAAACIELDQRKAELAEAIDNRKEALAARQQALEDIAKEHAYARRAGVVSLVDLQQYKDSLREAEEQLSQADKDIATARADIRKAKKPYVACSSAPVQALRGCHSQLTAGTASGCVDITNIVDASLLDTQVVDAAAVAYLAATRSRLATGTSPSAP